VRERIYADVDDTDLVLLELDLEGMDVPVVVEEFKAGATYPHVYGPLR